MRFMLIVPAGVETETSELPPADMVAAMDRYNHELQEAGVLLTADGLHDTSKGALIRFTEGQPVVVDGPFAEVKEMVAGFWMLRVKSKEEAVAWACKAPFPPGAHLQLRQVQDIEDWPEELRSLSTVKL